MLIFLMVHNRSYSGHFIDPGFSKNNVITRVYFSLVIFHIDSLKAMDIVFLALNTVWLFFFSSLFQSGVCSYRLPKGRKVIVFTPCFAANEMNFCNSYGSGPLALWC